MYKISIGRRMWGRRMWGEKSWKISQHVIPATQGQELHNLSSFEGHSSNDNKSFLTLRMMMVPCLEVIQLLRELMES